MAHQLRPSIHSTTVINLPNVKNRDRGIELISLQAQIGFERVELGLTTWMQCELEVNVNKGNFRT